MMDQVEYFNTPQRISQLMAEADKWVGTPFADYSAVPGRTGGASCGYMTLAVLEACGHVPASMELPHVSWRENMGTTTSTIEAAFDGWAAQGLFASLDPATSLLPGDVVGLRLKTALDHVALVLPQGMALSIRLRQRASVSMHRSEPIARLWRPLDHAAK